MNDKLATWECIKSVEKNYTMNKVKIHSTAWHKTLKMTITMKSLVAKVHKAFLQNNEKKRNNLMGIGQEMSEQV